MGELELKARRAWRRTTLLALIGAVVGAVIGGLLATTESGAVAVLTVVGFGASVGGLAGTFSILATTIGMSTAMQTTTAGLSPAGKRMVTQAIKTGSPIQPPESDLALRAREHARLLSTYQPLALGQFLLLYVGVAGIQFPRLADEHVFGSAFPRFLCAALLITALIMTPILLRAVRRSRRYLRAATVVASPVSRA
ncbi:hypothetical protein BIU95_17140 [Curtobacterium sp. MCBA15_007]|uniref:hypothetical protein n=1 Tax=Curtobacterium sp. MCBA15_007 TaxID=1898735 RepID=UPI0008DC8366|nr:hypothetical protein [Curtobacterium sp. MCBA15_007]OII04236.1 hypothetical protein BIU95_17140 [Curtobacterium sp. MCBA15_007]